MIFFTIPFSVTAEYSLNRFGEKHVRAKKKKAIEEATEAALLKQGLKNTKVRIPVRITLYYNSRLDIDNHGQITKGIIDVIKVYLLNGEDNKNSVVELVQRFWDKKDIGVTVETVAPLKGN